MSSETIPEWAMEMADALVIHGDSSPDGWDMEQIALSLLAAEQRGRDQAYAAAKASRDMDGSTSDDWDQGHACAYADALAAIRSLGEKT